MARGRNTEGWKPEFCSGGTTPGPCVRAAHVNVDESAVFWPKQFGRVRRLPGTRLLWTWVPRPESDYLAALRVLGSNAKHWVPTSTAAKSDEKSDLCGLSTLTGERATLELDGTASLNE